MRALEVARWTVGLCVLAGCGPGEGAPTVGGPAPLGLSTDRAVYAPGDSLALRLVPDAYVMYNLCHSQIQRWEGRWADYYGESRFVIPEERETGVLYHCQDIGLLADSGEVARYTIRLGKRIEDGTYRFRATVIYEDADDLMDTLATAPFTVE